MKALLLGLLLLTTTVIAVPSASAWGCENFAPGIPHAACRAVLHDDTSELRDEVNDVRCEADPRC